MAKTARERLARRLNGKEPEGSFSAQLRTPVEALELEVAGIGLVPLPIRAAQAKRLISVAQPAHFGQGTETRYDTEVRDTWEISPDQVTLGSLAWEQQLAQVLEQVHEQLGLPDGAQLTADLHSLLIYGKGQFFAPHQDSEKNDAMVATLVLSLPSVHTGGELAITHAGQTRTHHGDRSQLTYTAFYADCRHEIRKVCSGYRVTLAFNLLLEEQPKPAIDPDTELSALVAEHFATPVVDRWSGRKTATPNRLVVLLDHEYSQRGLERKRFKGRDAKLVASLQAAAARAGCDTAVALAEIKETWDVEPEDWDYYEDEGTDQNGSGKHTLQELIDDETCLGWWKRASAESGETISLQVTENEVCAATPTVNLTPYQSEYEGYMGNYGNTLDRWYRRAALVIWPYEREFAARAEANPAEALRNVAARLDTGNDEVRAQAAEDAYTVSSFLAAHDHGVLFPLCLEVAAAVRHAQTATALLTPLRGEYLRPEDGRRIAAAWGAYGEPWTHTVIEAWFDPGYHPGPRRLPWIETTLTGLCQNLRDHGADHVADILVNRLWHGMHHDIDTWIEHMRPAQRRNLLTEAGPAVAALLRSAGASPTRDISTALCSYPDSIIDLLLATLRNLPTESAAFPTLAKDTTARLEALLATPHRSPEDWSIPFTGCGCDLCLRVEAFLHAPDEFRLDWPLKQADRQHIHQRIDNAELPVRHETRRQGRPFTLELSKTRALFDRETEQRQQAAADLDWVRKTASGQQPQL